MSDRFVRIAPVGDGKTEVRYGLWIQPESGSFYCLSWVEVT